MRLTGDFDETRHRAPQAENPPAAGADKPLTMRSLAASHLSDVLQAGTPSREAAKTVRSRGAPQRSWGRRRNWSPSKSIITRCQCSPWRGRHDVCSMLADALVDYCSGDGLSVLQSSAGTSRAPLSGDSEVQHQVHEVMWLASPSPPSHDVLTGLVTVHLRVFKHRQPLALIMCHATRCSCMRLALEE